MGKLIGERVRALGFNTDFAPASTLRFEASKNVLGSRTVSDRSEGDDSLMRASSCADCAMPAYLAVASIFLDSARPTSTAITLCRRSTRLGRSLWTEDLAPYRELRNELPDGHGGTRFLPEDHRRQHAGLAFEKVDQRDPAQEDRLSRLVVSDDLDMGGVLNRQRHRRRRCRNPSCRRRYMFLVCQKEEHVWRAYEAVYKQAESDSHSPSW